MQELAAASDEAVLRQTRRRVWLGAALLALALVAGLFAVFRLAENQRDRELAAWQARLSIVADSRADSVARWLAAQIDAVASLADDPTVQLYAGALLAADGDPLAAEVQGQYLRNLLLVTAGRTGFAPAPRPDVPASVERTAEAGLAVLRSDFSAAIATAGFPGLPEELQGLQVLPTIADGFVSPAGRPIIVVAAPIAPVQGLAGDPPIGWVIGIKPLGDDLFERLSQPGEVLTTAETYLVRQSKGGLQPLSPLRAAVTSQDAAARAAVGAPGELTSGWNYAGVDVIAVARPVDTPLPWLVVRSVGGAEALAEIETRRTSLIIGLGLTIIALAAVMLLIWRHGASVRVARLAAEQAALAEEQTRLSAFLRALADAQPTAVLALDGAGRVVFANAMAGEMAGAGAAELEGKTLAAALGPTRAGALETDQAQARAGSPVSKTLMFTEGGQTTTFKADHQPLEGGVGAARSLLVLNDLSAVVEARERREAVFRQLIETVLSLIDSRDPHAAEQSKRVALVGKAIADSLGLEDSDAEVVELAGSLLNLGKLFVPAELLTRQDRLSDDELSEVRSAMQAAHDLLDNIPFEGPVVGTLRQAQQPSPDLEEILMTARILAVANAFVAMISARAHRPGLDVDTALAALNAEAGTRFDRKPIAALAHILDNQGGRERWAHFLD